MVPGRGVAPERGGRGDDVSPAGTRIHCSIDLDDTTGRRVGRLEVRHSDNRHAYGIIPVPIACIGNGRGPTALVSAGNHGDEHEGQVIARRLIRELDPERVHGRLIVIPALNYPAVIEDSRVSPLDGGNMNRAFPGDAGGTPTFAIAHYVETVLLPRCDAALDLHSGGKASEYLPCAYLVVGGDRDLMSAKIDAVKAFGAPLTTVVTATADSRSLSGAADRHAVTNFATELGGGGTLGRNALEVGMAGTRRWLAHLGLLEPEPAPPAPATRFLRIRSRRDFVVAPLDGLFEPRVGLGDEVKEGALAGIVHPVDDPERDGAEVRFASGGIVLCRRVPARTVRGDYLFHVGAPVEETALRASLPPA